MVSMSLSASVIFILGALCSIVEVTENAVSEYSNAWFQPQASNLFIQPLLATGVDTGANQNSLGGQASSTAQFFAWTSAVSGINNDNGNAVETSQPSISSSSDGQVGTNPFQNQWTSAQFLFPVNSFPISTVLASYPASSEKIPIPTVKRFFVDSLGKYANGLNITISSIPIIVETSYACIVTPVSPALVFSILEDVICLFSRVILKNPDQNCAQEIQLFEDYESRALSTYKCFNSGSCVEAVGFGHYEYLIAQGLTGETNFITIAAMYNIILTQYLSNH